MVGRIWRLDVQRETGSIISSFARVSAWIGCRILSGRVYWDQWLAWKAKSTGAKLVDASRSVTAIHQNHDYGDHANGKAGVVRCTVAEELQTGWRTVAPLHH
jgi:hypothetical protein